jgi:hypothetical protein
MSAHYQPDLCGQKGPPEASPSMSSPGTWDAFVATLSIPAGRKILALIKGRGGTGISLQELQLFRPRPMLRDHDPPAP